MMQPRDLTIDRRNEVPDLISYLRPRAVVINVEQCPQPRGPLPDYRPELARIFRVDRFEDIGENGSAVAAISLDGNDKNGGQGLFAEGKFVRDSMIAGILLRKLCPNALKAAIFDLAPYMGRSWDGDTLEMPGKWFHELWNNSSEFAQKILRENHWKKFPTYFAHDTTPLAIIGMAMLTEISPMGPRIMWQYITMAEGLPRHLQLSEIFKLSVNWLVRELESNPWGLLMYCMTNPHAHVNPTMPDSYDSMHNSKGELPNFKWGVAPTHDQGFAYDALLQAARVYQQFGGLDEEVTKLLNLAKKLRQSIFRHFWMPERDCFAAGVHVGEDGGLKQLDVVTALSFFLLNTHLFDEETPYMTDIVERMVKTLFKSNLLAPAGVRSLAMGEARFIPGGYHNGNIWHFMTHWNAEGLRRQGYHVLGNDFDMRIIRSFKETGMYSEYVNGGIGERIKNNERIVDVFDWDDWEHLKRLGVVSGDPALSSWKNRIEQPGQHIQLWSLATGADIFYEMETNRQTLIPLPFEEEVLSNQ